MKTEIHANTIHRMCLSVMQAKAYWCSQQPLQRTPDCMITCCRNSMFVSDGYGVERFDLMYNDFIIVGPEDDPAKIAGANDISAALTNIATTGTLFASRGDDSGTHKKEMSLWQTADITPDNKWYRSTGSGMGAQYGVIRVNENQCPNVDVSAAQTFIEWMLSEEGQRFIGGYSIDGQQLFFPNANI